jgi:hypothetical protein
MGVTRFSLFGLLALAATAAVAAGAGAATSPLAGCQVPLKYSSAAAGSHTSAAVGRSLRWTDVWNSSRLRCDGAARKAKVTATGTMLVRFASRSFSGKVVLSFASGKTEAGSVELVTAGSTSCIANSCHYSGSVTRAGKPAGTISGLLDTTKRTVNTMQLTLERARV